MIKNIYLPYICKLSINSLCSLNKKFHGILTGKTVHTLFLTKTSEESPTVLRMTFRLLILSHYMTCSLLQTNLPLDIL